MNYRFQYSIIFYEKKRIRVVLKMFNELSLCKDELDKCNLRFYDKIN